MKALVTIESVKVSRKVQRNDGTWGNVYGITLVTGDDKILAESFRTDESLKKLFVYIERTLYSKVPGTREEYDAFLEQITLIKKTLKGLK